MWIVYLDLSIYLLWDPEAEGPSWRLWADVGVQARVRPADPGAAASPYWRCPVERPTWPPAPATAAHQSWVWMGSCHRRCHCQTYCYRTRLVTIPLITRVVRKMNHFPKNIKNWNKNKIWIPLNVKCQFYKSAVIFTWGSGEDSNNESGVRESTGDPLPSSSPKRLQ